LERFGAELDGDHVTAGDRVQYDESSDGCTDNDPAARWLERHRHARLLRRHITTNYSNPSSRIDVHTHDGSTHAS